MSVPEVGKAFGKYKILRQLGRGGMGVVFLAEDETLGRRVALKILDRTLTSGGDFGRRFRDEARMVARLNHPNIVTVYDAGEADLKGFGNLSGLAGSVPGE